MSLSGLIDTVVRQLKCQRGVKQNAPLLVPCLRFYGNTCITHSARIFYLFTQ